MKINSMLVAAAVIVCGASLHRTSGQDITADNFLEFLVLQDAKDMDKMRAKIKEKEIEFKLLNVLPFSKWPKDVSPEQKEIRLEAEKRFQEFQRTSSSCLLSVSSRSDGGLITGDLYECNVRKWSGRTPAEKVGRGLFHFNVLLVQEGVTVHQPSSSKFNGFFNALKSRDQLFDEAEKYAIANKKGVWKDKEFAELLKKIASAKDAK